MKTPVILCTIASTLAFALGAPGKPNFLFIAIDHLRPELGCCGGTQVKSPNIDKLAGQGMIFKRAYCQVPICMGSRASLLTGILPTAKRFVGNCRADVDTPNAATLPEVFKNAGYTTLSNVHLATRVPLIVKVPGRKAGGSASLVETSDLFPTLCWLAGIEVPKTVEGSSFAALFGKPDQAFRDAAYSRFMTGDAIITERYTYTSYNGGKSEMLYDLEKDPNENENIAGKPESKETVKKMAGLLKQRQEEAQRFVDER